MNAPPRLPPRTPFPLFAALLFAALILALAACYRLPFGPAAGASTPEEAVEASIAGSDTAPHLFRTLWLDPDTAMVVFRGTDVAENVNFGYAVARREANGWHTGLVSGSGYAGELGEAVLHLVRLEEPAQGAVLYGVLIDPNIAGVQLTLPDGAQLPLVLQNGMLVHAFDLQQPLCSVTFTDTQGQVMAAVNLADRPEMIPQIDPEVQKAVDDLCPRAENQ